MEVVIRREDMDKTTTAEVLVKYLEQHPVNNVIREELTAYQQGEQVGFLKCMDFIKGICIEKE